MIDSERGDTDGSIVLVHKRTGEKSQQEYYSAGDLALMCNRSVATVWKWIRDGRFPVVKVGSSFCAKSSMLDGDFLWRKLLANGWAICRQDGNDNDSHCRGSGGFKLEVKARYRAQVAVYRGEVSPAEFGRLIGMLGEFFYGSGGGRT